MPPPSRSITFLCSVYETISIEIHLFSLNNSENPAFPIGSINNNQPFMMWDLEKEFSLQETILAARLSLPILINSKIPHLPIFTSEAMGWVRGAGANHKTQPNTSLKVNQPVWSSGGPEWLGRTFCEKERGWLNYTEHPYSILWKTRFPHSSLGNYLI